MGLLPLIYSTLSIFAALVFVTLLVSFILYKIKSPKKRPYMQDQPVQAAAPVYIRKVNYETIRQEPVIYYREPAVNTAVQAPQRQYNSTPANRFQVLNSQGLSSTTGFTYYR